MVSKVIPIKRNKSVDNEAWKAPFMNFLNVRLDEFGEKGPMDKLEDITSALFADRSEILGQLTLAFIGKRYKDLLEQTQCPCPHCNKVVKSRGLHKRRVETLVGYFELARPYFYCVVCNKGFYPLDEALELSPSVKQGDLQDAGVFLATKLPFEAASEAFSRCTGMEFSAQAMHACLNEAAGGVEILDVCPSKAQIEAKIAEFSKDKSWRPVLMLAVDGAIEPTRPEPSPRKSKRGKGEWREAKGFRFYLINRDRIEQLISWHQIASDQELAQALRAIKAAGLIPEKLIRLCVIADGAAWIWNRIEEIFPKAKQVLDFYHCSEHLHEFAFAHYGKESNKAAEWVEATLVRLSMKKASQVIAGIKRMKHESKEAERLAKKLASYLAKHAKRLDYGPAKRGGYHIGSGAIESANKFICHARLKCSGAWWYPSKANNMLKLRCAIFNGTYDRVMTLCRKRNRVRKNKSGSPGHNP